MQQITLNRLKLTSKSTSGELDVFGTKVFTLEDTLRDVKIYGESCIPAGTYELWIRPEGGKHEKYKHRFPDTHEGMIWLRNVPGFSWVYIHIGNTPADTLGCILVGLSKDPDTVYQSVKAYNKIYGPIVTAINGGGCEIVITDL